jgi:hypothetical protein
VASWSTAKLPSVAVAPPCSAIVGGFWIKRDATRIRRSLICGGIRLRATQNVRAIVVPCQPPQQQRPSLGHTLAPCPTIPPVYIALDSTALVL